MHLAAVVITIGMLILPAWHTTPRDEIERVANSLHDTLKLQRVAPGHCTSELASRRSCAGLVLDSTRLVLVLFCSWRDSRGRKTRVNGGGNGSTVMRVTRPNHTSSRWESRS
jgi:hypothetical protein